jgi:hypothetical protein
MGERRFSEDENGVTSNSGPFVASDYPIRGDPARLLAKCLAHDEVVGFAHAPFLPMKPGPTRRELTYCGARFVSTKFLESAPWLRPFALFDVT